MELPRSLCLGAQAGEGVLLAGNCALAIVDTGPAPTGTVLVVSPHAWVDRSLATCELRLILVIGHNVARAQ
jgi:hypothetical protein